MGNYPEKLETIFTIDNCSYSRSFKPPFPKHLRKHDPTLFIECLVTGIVETCKHMTGIGLFPDAIAIFVYVFSQCTVGWSRVKNVAACWGECLRLVNVAAFEGFNILFQLFYNVFHWRRITKMKSWRSARVPSPTRCSNW